MKFLLYASLPALLLACAGTDPDLRVYSDEARVPVLQARAETTPVSSSGDAADDPAIWLHPGDPAESLILGTDKDAGLAVYGLDGELKQFLPAGELNNVDLRQDLSIGAWRGDLAAASNRSDNSISLFAVSAEGIESLAGFPVAGSEEPYGLCLGRLAETALVFVTYKSGMLEAYRLDAIAGGQVSRERIGFHRFDSQLEGCVVDDAGSQLYVGEEARGIWHTGLSLDSAGLQFSPPGLIDETGGASGLAADVEGLALYTGPGGSYLIASSQGNDSYAIYDRDRDHAFLVRFRIGGSGSVIDGVQETDGLEASASAYGGAYPEGLLVVQDGSNAPAGSAQNFKLVDWREVRRVLTPGD